jgi:hypothetical protein
MKNYNETRVNVSGVVKSTTDKTTNAEVPLVNADGTNQTEDLNNILEKKYNEIVEFHKKQGWPEPQLLKVQTFTYSEPESLDEVIPLFVQGGLDENVAKVRAADVFNRGWAIEQQAEIRAFMQKSDPVEGNYDLLSDAVQPAERRQKDPMTAAANALKKAGFAVSIDDLKALMAQFAPASQAAAASQSQEVAAQ